MFECTFDFYIKRINEENFVSPLHSHTCFELIYYYSSGGYTNINGKKYEYQPGDFIIIPPLAHHDDYTFHETDIICIGFYYDNAEFTLEGGSYKDKSGQIRSLLEMLIDEVQKKNNHYAYFVNILLKQILIVIHRMVQSINAEAGNHEQLKLLLNYIDQYYLTDINLDQLAVISQYSYHRFRHVFKEMMNVSPKQYILSKRLAFAKKQLQETDISITELAYRCAFGSTSQFIKIFKQAFGMTPQAYRKISKNKDYIDSIIVSQHPDLPS